MTHHMTLGRTGSWRLLLTVAAAALSLALILQPPPWETLRQGHNTLNAAEFASAYSWIGAALSIGILGFMTLICAWWAEHAPCNLPIAPAIVTPAWFWPAVSGAVLICAWNVAPLVTQSLESDECSSLRNSVLGTYRRSLPDGGLKWKNADWSKTLFGYRNVNNHVFHNALAKVSNSAWRWWTRPVGLQFNEVAVRLPAVIAALGAIVALALLFAASGFPGAGAAAAWILALHPWFERYAASARGYSLLMFFLPVAMLCWLRGMQTGYWKYWGAFAACQFVLVWTHPSAIFVLIPLAVLTLFVLGSGISEVAPARITLPRWFCCNTLAAAAALPLMLPLVPQMRAYFDAVPETPVGGRWIANTFCYLLTGAPWTKRESFPPIYPEIQSLWLDQPAVFWFLCAAATVLLVLGAYRFACRAGMSSAFVACWLMAPILQFSFARLESMYIWEFYMIYVLPALVGLMALGLVVTANTVRRFSGVRHAAPCIVIASIAGFALLTQTTRAWQASHARTPYREATLLTRPHLNPFSPENTNILTAGTGDLPVSYDPRILRLRSAAELALLCHQAETQQRPLWLNLGVLWTLDSLTKFKEMLEDRNLFDQPSRLRAELPAGDRLVVRYRPGGVTQTDFARYLTVDELSFVMNNRLQDPERFFVAQDKARK
jgi:hypothetical protein